MFHVEQFRRFTTHTRTDQQIPSLRAGDQLAWLPQPSGVQRNFPAICLSQPENDLTVRRELFLGPCQELIVLT